MEPILYFREYQKKSENHFLCYSDNEVLYTNLDDKDELYLYCVYCNYVYYPSTSTIYEIIDIVKSWNSD